MSHSFLFIKRKPYFRKEYLFYLRAIKINFDKGCVTECLSQFRRACFGNNRFIMQKVCWNFESVVNLQSVEVVCFRRSLY